MTPADPQEAIRAFVRGFETQAAAARALGISSQYLNDLLSGQRRCSDRLLSKLNLRRIVVQAEA
jgi:plasmid maintenance system antidote protein VapI